MMYEILLVVAGGGLAAAILKFIEFLIQHKTHKEEHKEDIDDKIEDVKKHAEDFLTEANNTWKIKYCDRNAEAIQELANISRELKDNVILLTATMSEVKECNQNIGSAVNGIIHDRVLHNVNEYINRGGLTVEELSTLKSMYSPYKKLGGNGDVETAFEQVIKLPILTKEEATKRDDVIRKQRLQ